MAGDGVSLPTTLAQMGSVAKAQARGTQQGQTAAPVPGQQEKQDEIKVQRVQETKKSEKEAIDADGGAPDKRRRRRLNRNRKQLEHADADQDMGVDEEDPDAVVSLGKLIDRRV